MEAAVNEGRISALVSAADVTRTGAVKKQSDLLNPEVIAENEAALAEAKARVADPKQHSLVRCLICAHEKTGDESNYVAKSLITHLYSVHGMKKDQYGAYCVNKGYAGTLAEAPIVSPEMGEVFKHSGKQGAIALMRKVRTNQAGNGNGGTITTAETEAPEGEGDTDADAGVDQLRI